jgi:hypothetical protein
MKFYVFERTARIYTLYGILEDYEASHFWELQK